MSKTEVKPYASLEPAFINNQPSPVIVPGPDGRNVSVQPWQNRNRRQAGTFVVRGTHYQQFVSGAGPLYPFGGDLRWLELPGCDQGRGVDPGEPFPESREREITVAASTSTAKATRGKPRAKGTVVGADGTEKVDTWEDICAQLRIQLVSVGVTTRTEFEHAPAAVLLSCPHINEKNIARVREAAEIIFSDEEQTPAPTEAAESTAEPEDDPEAGGGEDEEEEPLRQYKRSDIEGMGKKALLQVVKLEDFDIASRQKVEEIREQLLEGLIEYEMLIEE